MPFLLSSLPTNVLIALRPSESCPDEGLRLCHSHPGCGWLPLLLPETLEETARHVASRHHRGDDASPEAPYQDGIHGNVGSEHQLG